MKSFKYGPLKVTVKPAGARPANTPYGMQHQAYVYAYKVTVSKGKAKYVADATGSIHDYETGVPQDDPGTMRQLARMVVEELSSALNDPDEFFDLVIGEERGRAAYERGKIAEKVVKAAGKFGEAAVDEAAEAARAEEEGEMYENPRSYAGMGNPIQRWWPYGLP